MDLARRRRGWRFGSRLLALLALVALVPALTLAGIGRGAVRSLAELAAEQSRAAVAHEAQQRLVSRAVALARAHDTFFGQVRQRAGTLASYIEWLYRNPEYYPPFLQGGTPLDRAPQGHLLNAATTAVGVFVPRTVRMTPDAWREAGLISQVDPFLAATREQTGHAARVWVTTATGIIRIYPNPGLGHPGSPVGPDDDPRDWEPFGAAVPGRNPDMQTVWSAPYCHPVGDGWFLTAAAPVCGEDGALLAVAGVDVRLEDVVTGVLGASAVDGGYSFLADADGRLISAPAEALADFGLTPGPAGAAPSLAESPLEGVRATAGRLAGIDVAGCLVQFDGASEPWYVGLARLPDAGWVLGVAAPAAVIEAGAREVREQIRATEARLLWRWGLALGGILLGVLAATHLATRTLTRPIARLVAGTRRLGDDLSYRLPEGGSYELADLARGLNRMAGQLELSGREAVAAARKAGEERQQALRAREVAVLEERNRLAREIHDTLAQGLTGMILQLDAAEDALEGGAGGARSRVRRARELARESLQEARRSVWNLRPQALAAGGLVPALESLAAGLEADGLEVVRRLTDPGSPPLLAEALYRIAQEAVANVRRHSRATRVEITLAPAGVPGVELSIRDNGRGFDPESQRLRPGGGFGLWAMRERAEAVGGSVTVASRPGRGTLVVARAPLDGGDAGGAADPGADRR